MADDTLNVDVKRLSLQEKEALLNRLEEQRRLQVQRDELKASLRHLYAMNWYQWAWDFFNSTNRYNFICAANQISKSSTQIRKCIHWATCKELWPKLWPTRPTQFWYFYPDFGLAHAEYSEKWVKEWLPIGPSDRNRPAIEIANSGAYHDHDVYGWHPEFVKGQIRSIAFNSGVTVYFKSYEQDPQALQAASVYAMFCDEELPEHLLAELQARCFSPTIKGYFHMVFTATLGQEIWRETIEERGTKLEKFPDAFKQQISMYDCLKYKDGSDSFWTVDEIQRIERACATEQEKLRRVYGKFVIDSDRMYGSFQKGLNVKPNHKLPKSWLIFSGIDYGSGGTAHPAAIVLVGVNPQFTKGRVFKAWRGDGEITESSDILNKFLELKGSLKTVVNSYDWQAADFKIIAAKRKVPLTPAKKQRDAGVSLLNTLFRNDILGIYDGDPELAKLVVELNQLKKSTPKPKAKDDLIDALRFACMAIPWDLEILNKKAPKTKDPAEGLSYREKVRRGLVDAKDETGVDLLQTEIDLANEAYEYGLDDEGEGGEGESYDEYDSSEF